MSRALGPVPGVPLSRTADVPPPALRELPDVLAPLESDLAHVGQAYDRILSGISWRTRDMVRTAARFDGKRLRPALTCVAARLGGRGVDDDVAGVAAIVELIHTATLVHDDVLDGAAVRRRVATVNARWGDEIAVLVGDVLFSKAYRAAAWLEDRFASRYLCDVVGRVLEGEIHQDLVWRNPDLTEEDYRQIIAGKTASLYEGALRVGAHYGAPPSPARDALEERLARYGHHLGMAFQIVDDRLDLAGDEDTVGKSLGRDLGEGKTTLPVILWLRTRTESERPAARALLEAAWEEASARTVLAARLACDGAFALADRAAQAEIEQALAALEGLPPSGDRTLLEDVARYVLARAR